MAQAFTPMDFQARQPAQSYTQNSSLLFANFKGDTAGGGVTFTARLRLPAGSRITAITLSYSTLGSPKPLYNGELLLVRGGSTVQLMGVGGSGVTRGMVTQATSSTLIAGRPSDLIVGPESEYAVDVYSHNVSTRIHGLKVSYLAP